MPPVRRAVRSLLSILLLALLAIVCGPQAARVKADTQQCFSETGQCLEGRFYEFWVANGGLDVFGYPLTGAYRERSLEDGRVRLTQWFERTRLELHPEAEPPYDVMLGRLGHEWLLERGVKWRAFPSADPNTPHYLAETGHAIGAPFAGYFFSHGLELGDAGVTMRENLALFGLPLSEAYMATNPSGDYVLTQWFERARFELHAAAGAATPEDAGEVMLGLLGREVRSWAGSSPMAPPPSALDGVTIELEEVASGLQRPLFVTHAVDGSGRLLVVEKRGIIRTLPGGEVFLDISDRVSQGNEQGLLGVAVHPRFRENGYLYLHYTDRAGTTTIARYTANEERSAAEPGSEKLLLQAARPTANHNGGMIAFGPDGLLYIAVGDGGGADDQYGNGQNFQTLHGKILRIDVDKGDPYTIPADNPFVNNPSVRAEIWAYGLRNPWRFSFDRVTGELFIADVGQDRYEALHWHGDGQSGGQNYGWPIREGGHCLGDRRCDAAGLATPIAEYDHRLGCSIVGGYVYRGRLYPQLNGAYIFGDFCSGRIWAMMWTAESGWIMTEMLETELLISSFGEDEAGELYLTDLGGGRVFRITARQQ